MDVKQKTSELLLTKLAFGCSDAKLQAVSEIRLFSKWDMNNRICLVEAGAIPLLIDLLPGADPRIQQNAVTALLNLSISPVNRGAIVKAPGALDAIVQVVREGLNSESKANAAALLTSLVLEESLRPVLGSFPKLLPALLELLRDGSSKCKADSLKALFHIAMWPPNKAVLVDAGAIPLLLSLIVHGKVKLTEDSLAVLAQVAGCPEGADSLMRMGTAIPLMVNFLEEGPSPRTQENAAAALFNLCRSGGDKAAAEVLDCRKCIPAILKLFYSGSVRGKSKAEALMEILDVKVACSRRTKDCVDEIRPEEVEPRSQSKEVNSGTRLTSGRGKADKGKRRLLLISCCFG